MKLRTWITTAGGAAALFGMLALSGHAIWAQEATPEAAEGALPPRPVHVHSGNCNELGEVIYPLTDLTAPTGDSVGQGRRASVAEYSYTSVPATLDSLLAEDFAINAHLSAEEIDTYIACGEIGGVLNAQGQLVIGLRESEDSGYAGIAYLSPGADGASTDVSVFVTPLEAPRGGGEEVEEAQTLPAEGTPVADTEGDALVAEAQVPVSLTEFAIDMPTEIAAGPVTFAVTNNGTVRHGFEVESEELGVEEELQPRLQPGETGMLTLDLAPGTYEVYCPVGDHASQGMTLEITVS